MDDDTQPIAAGRIRHPAVGISACTPPHPISDAFLLLTSPWLPTHPSGTCHAVLYTPKLRHPLAHSSHFSSPDNFPSHPICRLAVPPYPPVA